MLYVNTRFTSTLKSRTESKDRSRNDRTLERIARKSKVLHLHCFRRTAR